MGFLGTQAKHIFRVPWPHPERRGKHSPGRGSRPVLGCSPVPGFPGSHTGQNFLRETSTAAVQRKSGTVSDYRYKEHEAKSKCPCVPRSRCSFIRRSASTMLCWRPLTPPEAMAVSPGAHMAAVRVKGCGCFIFTLNETDRACLSFS